MKEIGGYMELEHYDQTEYHEGLLRLNTVRNAIALVMKERGYQKLFIPRYLCHSIYKMLQKYGYSYEFYDIDEKLFPIFHKDLRRNEAILIVNYFGQFNNSELENFHEHYQNLIIDNTQAFFQPPCADIDTAYTCRKYFGVSDGAYLNLTCPSQYYDQLPEDLSYTRMLHVLGRYEKSASDFYQDFQVLEEKLESEDIKKMSPLTKNLLKSIDYDTIIKKREYNFNYVHLKLQSRNAFNVTNNGGLYMYPFLTERGKELKNRLIQQKIYIPTLWPNVLNECREDSFEYYLAQNLILLPIDQRYTKYDMDHILNYLDYLLEEVKVIE